MTPPAARRLTASEAQANVALEGMDEPLPPGAIFPMDPTPVREDGLPLWEVEVVLRSDEGGLWDLWRHVERLEHPRLDGTGSYGMGHCHYDTRMRIWATDADEARAIADVLVDRALDGLPARRRLTATPAYADDYFDLPRGPEDYEPGLGRARWQRFAPTPAGVKIVWAGGVLELARVDVDETPERITITLWQRFPPRFLDGGTRVAIAGGGKVRAVEVPLSAPVGDRELVDGTTGHPPGHVDEFDPHTHALPDHLDLGQVPVQPMPTRTR